MITKGTSQGCDVETVMKALNVGPTLNDAAIRRAMGIPAVGLNKTLADQMKEILNDMELCKRLANTFLEQIDSDEEPPEKMGHYMAKAILCDSLEDFLIAVCGWSPATLVKLMKEDEQ